MTNREPFIVELNKALADEYGAAVQYIQHAAVITGAEYDAIAKELAIHADEEMRHAQLLSDIIADLGCTPSTEVSARHISNDSKTMLEQDLAGENRAIAMYKDLIAQAEKLREYGIRRTLEDILIDEEEHRRDLMSSLGL